jgi:hypothetical protein
MGRKQMLRMAYWKGDKFMQAGLRIVSFVLGGKN